MRTLLLILLACAPAEDEVEPTVGEWRCVKQLTGLTDLDTTLEGFDESPASLLAASTGRYESDDASLTLALPTQGVQHVDFEPELLGGLSELDPPVCFDELFVFTPLVWITESFRMDADGGLAIAASGLASVRASVRVEGGESRGSVDLAGRTSSFDPDAFDTIDVVLTGAEAGDLWSLELFFEATSGAVTETETIWTGETVRVEDP